MEELFNRLLELMGQNRDCVFVSIIASSGSVPRGAGAHMLVSRQGLERGTIGGGAVEYKALELAAQVLEEKSFFVQQFALRKNEVEDIGMVCGGDVEVYFRYISPDDRIMKATAEKAAACFGSGEESWLMMDVTGGKLAVYGEESGPAGGSGAAEGSGTTGDSASAEGGETTGGSASAEGGGSTGDSAAAESGGSGGDSASAEESSPTGDSASPAPQSAPLASVEKKSAPRVAAPAEGSPYTLAEVAGLLGEKTAALEEIAGRSRSLARSMSNLMDDTADAAEYSQDIVDNLDYLIEDLTALNDSLDTYYPDLQEALDDSARLVERTTEALSSGVSLMTIVQNTLKASSEDMDQAARDSLAAGMQVLDKSLGILDSTEAMRRAGRVMKDTMDGQLDKFDTENRFLFMDPSAEKSSFTSEKNPEPNTLQVVLRTEEISQEESKDGMLDNELSEKQESPLKRMWNVLVKMWQAITDIFRER